MRPRLLLTINCKFAVDFFARGLHTRTAVARLPLRQLGFLVLHMYCRCLDYISCLHFLFLYLTSPGFWLHHVRINEFNNDRSDMIWQCRLSSISCRTSLRVLLKDPSFLSAVGQSVSSYRCLFLANSYNVYFSWCARFVYLFVLLAVNVSVLSAYRCFTLMYSSFLGLSK